MAGYAVGPVEYNGKNNFEQFFSNFAKMAVDPGLLLKDSLNDSSFSQRKKRVIRTEEPSSGGFFQSLQRITTKFIDFVMIRFFIFIFYTSKHQH